MLAYVGDPILEREQRPIRLPLRPVDFGDLVLHVQHHEQQLAIAGHEIGSASCTKRSGDGV
jgi:hypothetical protein